MNTAAKSVRSYRSLTSRTVYPILLMVSITHLLNDMMQSVSPAVYPLLKEKFDFTFAQIGLITLVFQLTSSLLQPVAGLLADRHPRPYSLAGGMCFTLAGLLVLAFGAFYPAATLCRSGRDRRAVRSDRAGHFVGLFRHSGLCHRSDARQGGDDRRSLFRPDVRAGRSRFGVFRLAGGPDEYRVYFSGQHAVAPVGCYHRFFAEYRVEKRKIGFSVHVLLLLFGAGRG